MSVIRTKSERMHFLRRFLTEGQPGERARAALKLSPEQIHSFLKICVEHKLIANILLNFSTGHRPSASQMEVEDVREVMEELAVELVHKE